MDRIVPAELAELMYRTDKRGCQRILRSVYECGVFQALREQLRCKERTVRAQRRLPSLDWLQIAERKKGGAIQLTPLEPLSEPRNLRKLKAAIRAR